MKHGWDQLDDFPNQLDYVREVARKYASYRNSDPERWERTIRALQPEELKEITDVYREMARRNHAEVLSEWIVEQQLLLTRRKERWEELKKAEEAGGPTAPPEPQSIPLGEQLFDLFGFLASQHVKPFADRHVRYSEPRPDWNRFPAELEWLREPAMKWGVYQFDEQRDELDRRITPEEVEELRQIAKRVREPAERQRIDSWMRGNDSPEAAMVMWMRAVLAEFVPEQPQLGLEEHLRPDPALLDWSKLPSRLRYLSSPAQKYGNHQGMDGQTEFMIEMVDEQEVTGEISPRYLELEKLAERVRSREDRALIERWFNRFPQGQHPEAALVMSLLVMLDDYFPS